MVLARKKTPEQQRVDAYVSLLVAESEFLKANGWAPVAMPGSSVHWVLGGGTPVTQDAAVEAQKRRERA